MMNYEMDEFGLKMFSAELQNVSIVKAEGADRWEVRLDGKLIGLLFKEHPELDLPISTKWMWVDWMSQKSISTYPADLVVQMIQRERVKRETEVGRDLFPRNIWQFIGVAREDFSYYSNSEKAELMTVKLFGKEIGVAFIDISEETIFVLDCYGQTRDFSLADGGVAKAQRWIMLNYLRSMVLELEMDAAAENK